MGRWSTNKEGQLGYQINRKQWVSWYFFTADVLKSMLAEKVISNLDYLAAMRDVKK